MRGRSIKEGCRFLSEKRHPFRWGVNRRVAPRSWDKKGTNLFSALVSQRPCDAPILCCSRKLKRRPSSHPSLYEFDPAFRGLGISSTLWNPYAYASRLDISGKRLVNNVFCSDQRDEAGNNSTQIQVWGPFNAYKDGLSISLQNPQIKQEAIQTGPNQHGRSRFG